MTLRKSLMDSHLVLPVGHTESAWTVISLCEKHWRGFIQEKVSKRRRLQSLRSRTVQNTDCGEFPSVNTFSSASIYRSPWLAHYENVNAVNNNMGRSIWVSLLINKFCESVRMFLMGPIQRNYVENQTMDSAWQVNTSTTMLLHRPVNITHTWYHPKYSKWLSTKVKNLFEM